MMQVKEPFLKGTKKHVFLEYGPRDKGLFANWIEIYGLEQRCHHARRKATPYQMHTAGKGR